MVRHPRRHGRGGIGHDQLRLRAADRAAAAGAVLRCALPVLVAATRAREAVQAAWLVLGDAERRNRYDKEIGLHRERGRGFAHGDSPVRAGPVRRAARRRGPARRRCRVAFTALAAWLAPLPAPPRRRLTVPDTRGLFYRSCQAVVTVAGMRLATVQLTAGAVAGRGARRRPVAGAGLAGPAPEHADRAGMAPAAPPPRACERGSSGPVRRLRLGGLGGVGFHVGGVGLQLPGLDLARLLHGPLDLGFHVGYRDHHQAGLRRRPGARRAL